MTQTQQQDVGKQLQDAVMQAAVSDAAESALQQENESKASAGERQRPVSPLSGAPTPPGRPRGVRNKLTNLRDAVIEAFDKVGGVEYLVRLANGTQSDRAAFTSLMNKVLPTQINQQVEGGIRLELTWLGGRQIGATQAQIESQHTQALDLERDSDGRYRIKDQQHAGEGGDTPAQGDGQGDQPTAQNGLGGASGA